MYTHISCPFVQWLTCTPVYTSMFSIYVHRCVHTKTVHVYIYDISCLPISTCTPRFNIHMYTCLPISTSTFWNITSSSTINISTCTLVYQYRYVHFTMVQHSIRHLRICIIDLQVSTLYVKMMNIFTQNLCHRRIQSKV